VTFVGINDTEWFVVNGSPLSVDNVRIGDPVWLNEFLSSYHAVDHQTRVEYDLETNVMNDITLTLCNKVTVEGIENASWLITNGTPFLENRTIIGNSSL